MLNRGQIITIGLFTALFFLLYFGCSTKSKKQLNLEKSRATKFELISIDRLIAKSMAQVSPGARVEISQINEKIKNSDLIEEKLDYYKSLASVWYGESFPLISGYFAEKIATETNDASSWGIAGTTFSIAAQRTTDSNEKQYAIEKSRVSFEKSLSIQPDIDNEINLALTYVEAPLEENPMKGILMLRELNENHPENVSVIMQLARLSLQTGQYDKAVERLEKVIELRPSFANGYCLLAEVLRQKGNTAASVEYQTQCDNLKK